MLSTSASWCEIMRMAAGHLAKRRIFHRMSLPWNKDADRGRSKVLVYLVKIVVPIDIENIDGVLGGEIL